MVTPADGWVGPLRCAVLTGQAVVGMADYDTDSGGFWGTMLVVFLRRAAQPAAVANPARPATKLDGSGTVLGQPQLHVGGTTIVGGGDTGGLMVWGGGGGTNGGGGTGGTVITGGITGGGETTEGGEVDGQIGGKSAYADCCDIVKLTAVSVAAGTNFFHLRLAMVPS